MAAGRDDGVALATVTAISAILFLLATTLVMLATQSQVSASNQVQRTKALHAADAGVTAYTYKLSQAAHDYLPLSGSTADASWTVTSVAPTSGGNVTQLTSVGTIKAQNGAPQISRTIKASVKPASAADYMFFMNAAVTVGSGAIFHGDVWSNSTLTNNGEITGYAWAVSAVPGGSGTFDHTPQKATTAKQFGVGVNLPSLQATATADGTYWPDSGWFKVAGGGRHYLGYKVTLQGAGGTVQRIQSVSTTTGVITVDPTPSLNTSFTIPANGVLYFDDAIWLSGSYSKAVTIVDGQDLEDAVANSTGQLNNGTVVTNNVGNGMNAIGTTITPVQSPPTYNQGNAANSSVYLWNNLQSADPSNVTVVLGVVTNGDISLTSEYPLPTAGNGYVGTPNDMTLQGAFMAVKGSIHTDFGDQTGFTNITKHSLTLVGAFASYGSVGMVKNDQSEGWLNRNYYYDPNLNYTTPPNYPPFGDGTMHVNSWVEQ